MNRETITIQESQDAVRIAAMLFSALGFIVGALTSAMVLP